MYYHVKPLRDGKSFRARYVEGRQDGQVVLSALANFYRVCFGTHQHLITPPPTLLQVLPPTMIASTPMPQVPAPEHCTDLYEQVRRMLADHEAGTEKLDERRLALAQRRLFDFNHNFLEVSQLEVGEGVCQVVQPCAALKLVLGSVQPVPDVVWSPMFHVKSVDGIEVV